MVTPTPKKLLTLFAIAAAYLISARIGLALATSPSQVTAIWPPSGVAVASLFIFGTWCWPAIAAGAFVANAFANEPLTTAMLIAVGNTLEGVIAVHLLRRKTGFRPSLDRAGDIVWLAIPAAVGSSAVAATIGVASLWLGNIVQAQNAPGVWLLWWLGDAGGIFVLAPLLLIWHSATDTPAWKPRWTEVAAFFAGLIAVSAAVFMGPYAHSSQIKFFLFPFVVWSAYRLGQRYTAAAVVLIATISIVGQMQGSPAFVGDSLNERFLILQGFVAVMAFTGLCLGALVTERRMLLAELESAQATLEQRVRDKTLDLEQEIQARRKSEADLSVSEKTLQDFINNLTTFTAKLDTEGKILMAGRAAQLASGMPLEELLKVNFLEGPWWSFDPAVQNRVRQAFEQACKGAPINYDEQVRVFGNVDLTINFSLIPVSGEDGEIQYILAEGRDITAQKTAELSLRKTESALKASHAELETRVAARTSELSQATERLQQSEQRLQAIIDNSNAIVHLKDMDGKYLLVNREWEKTTNVRRERAIGRSMYDFYPKAVADRLAENDREVISAGAASQFEEKVAYPSGETKTYISNKFPLLDETGRAYAICGISTDITLRKKIEKRISLQYAITKILAESPDFAGASSRMLEEICVGLEWDAGAIWMIHPQKDHLGCAHICNAASAPSFAEATRAARFTRGEGLPGHVWESRKPLWIADLHKHDNFPRAAAAAKDGLISGLGFPIQVGSQIYGIMEFFSKTIAEPDSEIIALMGGIGTQIGQFIQRRSVDREISESEARKRAILESALDCIITIDHRGRVIEWNPAAEKTFGYSRSEVIERDMADLIIPPRFRDSHRKGLSHFLATGEAAILNKRLELDGVRKDGSEFPCELAITRVPGVEPPIFTGYLRDITERKQVEQREKQAKEQAERANRAKDEFLAVVSHELRTPLTPILGWTRILRSGRLDPSQVSHALETIERNVKAQGKLIEDLLDISRVITGKLKVERRPMALGDVLPIALETVQPAADAKHIEIHMACQPGVGAMLGDAERLQQVVWNLLSNAIKFSPPNGRVDISIRETTDHVEVWVEDNGPGIDPSFLPHIFNRFSQQDSSTTRKHGGLGLGLAIVRHIAELHGGSVSAENRRDAPGALFKVRLPRSDAPAATGLGDTAPDHNTPASGSEAVSLKDLRVLVIDNDDDVRHLIATSLRQWGAEVVTASSSSEGLEMIRTAKPGIVLCDIGMPVDDGYAFLQRLRAQPQEGGRDLPVIALTAYTRAEERERIIAAGFLMHIPKPVDPFELARILARFTKVG